MVAIGKIHIMAELSPTLCGVYCYFKTEFPCYWSAFPALDQKPEHFFLGVEDGKTVVETPKVGETLNF